MFSVKAEKYKVGIQLTDKANIARVGVGWGSESSPQTPASHSDSETPLLLGRGCRVLLVLHRPGSEGTVILENPHRRGGLYMQHRQWLMMRSPERHCLGLSL